MAAYYGSEAYDFSLFENNTAEALPEYTEEPQIRRAPAQKPKAAAKPAVGELRPAVKATVAVLMSVVIVACCGILLNRRAEIDDYAAKINAINKQIKLEKSDNIRLNNDINSLFSKKEVEYYAENILGMVKLDNYNTIQISLPKSDQVVVSGGKDVKTGVVNTEPVLVLQEEPWQPVAENEPEPEQPESDHYDYDDDDYDDYDDYDTANYMSAEG